MRRIVLAAAFLLAFTGARQRPVRIGAPPSIVPTFDKEVVRIMQAHCQSCHHPGDIGPFSMMTWASAYPHASDIKYMTQSQQMPPWKPVQSCNTLDSPRVLSPDEIDTLARWVDNGAPEGNPADLPPALDFGSGWALGQPDLVLKNPQAYTPPSVGDMYRCYTMPTNLIADQYVSAIDVHPGDRQTVHHVLAFIDTNGSSQQLDDSDPASGYPCFGGPGFTITNPSAAALGGWAPGARPVTLPDGVAMLLPKNSRVVLQVHYHPHGPAPLPDQTEIGIYYARQKPTKLLRILPLINNTFTIPPGDSNYRVTAEFTIPLFNTHLWVIAPHMHLLGRKISVQATLPNGAKECLINVDDWDFNWQGLYRFQDAVPIPAGTRLTLESFYDNSSANWRNPNDPPKSVSWGEATTDEMCLTFIGFTIDAENLAQGKVADASWVPAIPR